MSLTLYIVLGVFVALQLDRGISMIIGYHLAKKNRQRMEQVLSSMMTLAPSPSLNKEVQEFFKQ